MSRVMWLYLMVVLIWGSTWFAIRYQLSVPPLITVFHRFGLASLISFALCYFRKQDLRFSLGQHKWFLFQGICLFSMNYILFYEAEKHIASGLVAATFTLVIYFNMLGVRVFFGQAFSKKLVIGSLLGGAGICLLFWDSISNFRTDSAGIKGLLLGVVATVFASGGNLMTTQLKREKIPLLSSTSWALLYGTLFTLLLIGLTGEKFVMDTSLTYWSALIYLSLFGTVIAFAAYLTLIGEIGADRAAYSNILTPVIALIISSIFENFQWQWWTIAGVLLCIAGNYWTVHLKPKV
jgi:drug/metabolite transporter (DMT)-like permease